MSPHDDASECAVAVIVLSSIGGFAFSALAGAGLAHLAMEPVRAVRTMALCSLAIQLYAVWNIRAAVRWRGLWPMIAAGVATIPLGVWLLLHIDARAYGAGLGLFTACYGIARILGRDPRRVAAATWRDMTAGALGGITGGLAGFPGLFVTIWCSMRGGDKLEQRAVYQPYILAMQAVTLLCLRWITRGSPSASESIGEGLGFVPFALLGAMGGLKLFRRMTNSQFGTALGVLLVASGAALLARAR
jgi:uncharacterized protein